MSAILKVIEKYVSEIPADKFHRYKSWDHCFSAFAVEKPSEFHSLHLAFFLASWGMYRGSGGLLQKNHLVHQGAVEILFQKRFRQIKCRSDLDVTAELIDEILVLKETLAAHYKKIHFVTAKGKGKWISTTDTLISKIMLGTLGCVPAYDTYFVNGLVAKNIKYKEFDASSLAELFDFLQENKREILACQALIKSKTKMHYPVMKIIDMYFWQIGFGKINTKVT